MSAREDILERVDVEREYQDIRWGESLDDRNSLHDWSTCIYDYLLLLNSDYRDDTQQQKETFIKIAALSVAAIESLQRNKDFPKALKVTEQEVV